MKLPKGVPANLHPVVKSAAKLLQECPESARAIAQNSDVTRSTMQRWFERNTQTRSASEPSVASLDRVLETQGYQLAIVPKDYPRLFRKLSKETVRNGE